MRDDLMPMVGVHLVGVRVNGDVLVHHRHTKCTRLNCDSDLSQSLRLIVYNEAPWRLRGNLVERIEPTVTTMEQTPHQDAAQSLRQ